MSHLKTQFVESRSSGDNKDQGLGGGDAVKGNGDKFAQRNGQTGGSQGSQLVPKPADVNGPVTPERGGEGRKGHTLPAPSTRKTGDHLTPRKGS